MAISDRTRKILWAKAGGRCSICRVMLVSGGVEGRGHSVFGEEAHIVSAAPTGPRAGHLRCHDDYDNLILLCSPHHKLVDDQVDYYTNATLRRIKSDHETWVDQLGGSETALIPGSALHQRQDAMSASPYAGLSAGRPLTEVTDPFDLEVHRPIQAAVPKPDLPELPVYVARDHDAELRSVVETALGGTSRIAVLVGGSSTGKTRACWEALDLLREAEPGWRLWHPIDPSRPEAALGALGAVGPRTVLWLNEAQFYLDAPERGMGERLSAGLRVLLRNPARSPVLVLATLWPTYWAELTFRPTDREDFHPQARELLTGHEIAVLPSFTTQELKRLEATGDERLTVAAAHAKDRQIIQFIAGAPDLLARHRNAPVAARAILDAAIDARRMGMRRALPGIFLAEAAGGYFADVEWDRLNNDWLELGLAYATAPCKGSQGPLARVRQCSTRFSRGSGADLAASYRLSDYLDEVGRWERREQIPPASFWSSAAAWANPGDLYTLGEAARGRGLFCDAARLFKQAIARGDPYAACNLIELLNNVGVADSRATNWIAANVPVCDPEPVPWIISSLRHVDAEDALASLADRAVADMPLQRPNPVAEILEQLRTAGARKQIEALLRRKPADQALIENSYDIERLLDELVRVDARQQANVLAYRAATLFPLDDPGEVGALLASLSGRHAQQYVSILLCRRPDQHACLADVWAVERLLKALRKAKAQNHIYSLGDRAVASVPLDDPVNVAVLLDVLRESAATTQVARLLDRDPAAHVKLHDPGAVARVLESLREADAPAQVMKLLARNPAMNVVLEDTRGVADLLEALRNADAVDQVTTLCDRAIAAVPLDNCLDVGVLMGKLQAAGRADDLLSRDPTSLSRPAEMSSLLHELLYDAGPQKAIVALVDYAATAPVTNPRSIAGLLRTLHLAGATAQTAMLAERAVTGSPLDDASNVAALINAMWDIGVHQQITALLKRSEVQDIPLDHSYKASRLLQALRNVGAHEEADLLIARMPASGSFDNWLEERHLQHFIFGREPNGDPAQPWNWKSLD